MLSGIFLNQRILSLSAIPIFLVILMVFIRPTEFGYWFEFWWMFPIAFIIALTVNTLGVSGGALFIPFFILLFPFFAEPLTTIQSIKLGLITESFGLSSSALVFLSKLFEKFISLLFFYNIGGINFFCDKRRLIL